MHLKTHSFRFAEEILNSKLRLKNEIFSVLNSIPPIFAKHDRKESHKLILQEFKNKGWGREARASNQPIGKWRKEVNVV